jgi:hypothetical protein
MLMVILEASDSKYADAVAAIIAALVALPVGIGIERYRRKQDQKDNQPVRVSAFLEILANALSGMVSDFEQGRIPYQAGHQFAAMVDAFQPDAEKALGKDSWTQIESLRQLAVDADDVDGFLGKYGNPDSPFVVDWVTRAKRAIGEIKAEAAKRRLG